jgi:hexosaminidase
MKTLIFCLVLLITLVGNSQQVNIIPKPSSVKTGNGQFVISKQTVIAAQDDADRKTAELFNEYLQQFYGFKLDIDRQEGKDYIRLTTRKFIQAQDKDAYTLNVSSDGVSIEGNTYAGTFYGMQTLIQLLPVDVNGKNPAQPKEEIRIPFVTIQDEPAFKYRGMHLDVARHFFPIPFVKKYIDYLALHKLNYFHWHLTDDQGWRIEIKKYPELQSVAAWRNGTIIGRYPGTGNDNTRYGGYYTQEEVKDIVKYAADRHITVIPEIEMPGHASAAIAAFPWLSCFPEKPTKIPTHPSVLSTKQQEDGRVKLVQETWGIFEDVFCAGNDSTFMFLQNILDEIVPLFPSQYIHIGGDECPKSHWKICPECQRRMKDNGLKDEHELQSYFIQRMEKYLNNKGRIIIGWDEILEGGLAPNAIVMSWRGEKGGIEAARQNHYVIMTPQKPLYFDHTQTKNEDSIVIGGYNPIEAVYAYDPIPEELNADKEKFILGAQANVWTEYIRYPARVEYHVFPRISALSEVLWTSKENKSWTDFEKRLPAQFKRFDLWKANYSKAYYDVKVSIVPAKNFSGLSIVAEPRDRSGRLVYHSGNSVNAKNYNSPVMLTRSGNLTLDYYNNNVKLNTVQLDLKFTKATGKKITITKTPNEKYPGQGGAFSLVNGIYSNKGLSYPDWLGWIGDDMVATIDLGKTTGFDSVRVHTIDQNGSWVYLPEYVEVLVSKDGKKYSPVGKSSDFRRDTLTMGWINVPVKKQNSRYVKVIAKNYGLIPDGKPGAGTKAWVFADEIQIF